MNRIKWLRAACAACAVPALTACSVGPVYREPLPASPAQFQASLPSPGDPRSGQSADLATWWRQFDDPLVAELVDAALQGNPGLDRAAARIAQARAAVAVSEGGRFPELQANAALERGGLRNGGQRSTYSVSTRSLDARWEIDLFGARRNAAEAARARWSARDADWHAARVSLASEVAATLVTHRACTATVGVLEQDAKSRHQTAQLTRLKVKAGFTSSADGLLIDASAADVRQRLIATQAECDLQVKALVALTDVAEPALRTKLAARPMLPRPAAITVDAVPARMLAQRPDIAAAERALKASSADINVAEANRYPSISLTGSVGRIQLSAGGAATSAWSLLPAISVPLFDAGVRKAEVQAAQAVYAQAHADYRQTVRDALRETEQTLVRLDASARREADAAAAARDYALYFTASEDRFKAGPGSLFELEDARRSGLAAQLTLIGVQQDRVLAWIALYKAIGGGWQPAAAAPHMARADVR